MPWKEIKIMDQREHFVRDWLTGNYPKGALCALYGISRPTGTSGLSGIMPRGWRGWPTGHNGEVRWRGHVVYLSEVLAQEPVGFTLIGESTWAIHYSFHLLGTLDDRTCTITSARHWHQAETPQAM